MATLRRVVRETYDAGVIGLNSEDAQTDGRRVRLHGRDLLHFGSCSYLGLELDPRLVTGAIDALRAHGVETSSSRAYLSSGLYVELESLLAEIFTCEVVIAPTTTLAHCAALPTLIDEADAILMDLQVHASVQMACRIAQAAGTRVDIVRHNDVEALERRVERLSKRHDRIWYVADGVYSMFGDFAPTAAIAELLDRHPQLRFYVDDAHGMSWCGRRGAGSVLDVTGLHPQMILATGLAKGFGTGGGVLVIPDEEERWAVRRCGSTLVFSGPLQPPILGAAIASARIHLSDEIEQMQRELQDRMALCDRLLRERGLPVVSSPDTPIGFIATGPPATSVALCQALSADGIFTNPAQYPATPLRRGGGRFLLTRHHEAEDIERLADGLERHWESAVREGGCTPEEVYSLFDLEPPIARCEPAAVVEESILTLETANSIDKLDRTEWNRLLGDRGCIAQEAISVYEDVFGAETSPENAWQFRYYIVRDRRGEPVLATCFTAARWKADMLAPAEVSAAVETRRESDPFFLTHKVFAMGCLLSEGDHLWLRGPVESAEIQDALSLLLERVRLDAAELGCQLRVVRDVPDEHAELGARLEREGFMRVPMPEGHVIEDLGSDELELIGRLGRDHRRHYARSVRPWNDAYVYDEVGVEGRPLRSGEAAGLRALYENVKARSLSLNTFALPETLIPKIAESPGWELLVFRKADEVDGDPVAFLANFVGGPTFVPLLVGLDYALVEEGGLYRQVLRHLVNRARARGFARVEFGFAAGLEKRRFGARPKDSSMWIEVDDVAILAELGQLAAGPEAS